MIGVVADARAGGRISVPALGHSDRRHVTDESSRKKPLDDMATPHQRFARPVGRSCVGCQPGSDARSPCLRKQAGRAIRRWRRRQHRLVQCISPNTSGASQALASLCSSASCVVVVSGHHRCHSQHWEQSGAVELKAADTDRPSNAQDGEPGTVGPVAEFRSSLVSSSRAAPARELRFSRPPIRYSRPPYLSCSAFPGARAS